ncbi:MAG: NAD(P)-binding protein [Betaproteobacteria bacterium]|nr:NAD(P)-binding protein [Betaproteobacteria bacterium]
MSVLRTGAGEESYCVAGAGPAGLAAAITLARAGRRVVVHEAHREVGHRFQRDLQGLENWTSDVDVLDEFRRLGIATDFRKLPCPEGTAFDAAGRKYRFRSRDPLFYVVERGPGEGTLDSALLAQAREAGVELRFGDRLKHIDRPGILATGPRAADAIAVGYHFDTDMSDGCWVICDDTLAPEGYAYLLVMNGRGTVKSCMFTGFKQESKYVARTVEAFERLAGLRMDNPRPHGGVGNFRVPVSAYSGRHPTVGEQAGFQDTLWGFGMRYAIVSGVLAARSLLEGTDYDAAWNAEFGGLQQAGIVNRALFAAFGNTGYAWILRRQEKATDARTFLRAFYRPTLARRLLLPWARNRYRSRRRDESCDHLDCACVWCRCGGEYT